MWHYELPWYEMAMLWILRQGGVPCHVAIMPDGNRRFSRRTGTDLHQTYVAGTRLYGRVCLWCFGTGVQSITAFLLAERHVRRCVSEKAALLSGVIDTCMEGLHDLNKVRSLGVKFRNCGPMELLPRKFQIKLAALEVATTGETRTHKPVTFYIDGTKSQMRRMARDLAEAVTAGVILQDDITAKLIDDYLALVECADANMLMRCAGSRLSDFAVPQCSYAYLNMEPKLWEELSFWNWIWAFLRYQLHWPAIEAVKKRHDASLHDRHYGKNPSQVFRQRKFMMQVQMSKMGSIDAIAGAHVNPETYSRSSTLALGLEKRACKSALGKRQAEEESSLVL